MQNQFIGCIAASDGRILVDRWLVKVCVASRLSADFILEEEPVEDGGDSLLILLRQGRELP